MFVKHCDGIIDEQTESHVLMLRAGMDPENIQDGLKICHNHRKLLGRSFIQKIYGQSCHHPDHGNTTRFFSEGTRMYKVDYQRSLRALREEKIKIPYGTSVCKKCHDLLENEVEQMESLDMFDDYDDEVMSEAEGDTDFVLSQAQEEIVKAFQEFVQQTGDSLDFKVSDVLSKQFDKYKDKLKLLETMSSGIDAVLKAVTTREDQKIELWNRFKESGLLEDRLGVSKKPAKLLIETIKAHRSTKDKKEKRRILSLLTPAYTLEELQVFNDEDQEVTWEPKINWYLFNEAQKHYSNFGHGLAELPKRKAARWKFDKDMVRSVIMFVLGKNP